MHKDVNSFTFLYIFITLEQKPQNDSAIEYVGTIMCYVFRCRVTTLVQSGLIEELDHEQRHFLFGDQALSSATDVQAFGGSIRDISLQDLRNLDPAVVSPCLWSLKIAALKNLIIYKRLNFSVIVH